MGDESEIFEKPKEKRKLSQKQLDALARGRAKQAEKRRLALEKQDKKEAKEVGKIKQEKKKEKKVRIREQEILEKVKVREKHNREVARKEEALARWDTIRADALSKCTTLENFRAVEKVLDEVDDDMATDNTKLQEFFKNKYSAITKKDEPEKQADKSED